VNDLRMLVCSSTGSSEDGRKNNFRETCYVNVKMFIALWCSNSQIRYLDDAEENIWT